MDEAISNAEYSTVNIRAIEIRFDTVCNAEKHFILLLKQAEIARVAKDFLDLKTKSKLTSMSD